MQVGNEDREAVQVAGRRRPAQEGLVRRALLLIDRQHELLLRGIPRFDDMSGPGLRVGG